MENEMNKVAINKKGFINAMKSGISLMKTYGTQSFTSTQAVCCCSPTNDATQETWNITLHNLSGRKFRAYAFVQCEWKNGKAQDISYPVEIWDTQKEFIEFLERECDKG